MAEFNRVGGEKKQDYGYFMLDTKHADIITQDLFCEVLCSWMIYSSNIEDISPLSCLD